jgi:N-acetylmuramoyl-L-alanine amidase
MQRQSHPTSSLGAPYGVAGLLGLLLAVLVCSLCAMSPARGEGHLQAHGYKMAGDAARTRIVIHFDREPDIRWFLLRGPHRMVVDLPEAAFGFDEAELEPRGMVTDVRYGNLDQGRSRVILSFDGPFEIEKLDILENESAQGYRLVADIVAGSEAAFEAAMAEQIEATGATQTTPKADRVGQVADPRARRFRVMIDAGHGGIDTGAKGVSGTLEKTITLAFALELQKKLRDGGNYDVFLTRDRDLFLRLDERVRIARQQEADLLISIHADAIRLNGVRGATVYTVADKASDAEAAAKAIRENLADEVAGISVENDSQEVADILADLIRRETQSFSIRFARSLVGELSSSIQMINKNPHRFAGFRVLRAPDVPSVLLELGYLSNADDEQLLRDPEWRSKAAEGIVQAIDLFAAARQGAGG